jgi:hypothetical protein
MTRHAAAQMVAVGTLAGLAGGLAEIVWIWTYASLTNADASLVARSITDTMQLGQALPPVLSGVGIHLALAVLLGVAVAIALRSATAGLYGLRLYAAVTATLVVVWAVNFFVVLPVINPQFVGLVPYAVSFVSKLLFGVAAAGTLQAVQAVRPAMCRA